MSGRKPLAVEASEASAGGGVPSERANDKRWQPLLTVTRVSFDAAGVATAVAAAFLVRFGLGWFAVASRWDLTPHLIAAAVWMVSLLGTMALNRLYDNDTLFPGGGELSRLLRSVVESVAVLSVVVYFVPLFSVSRSWVALTVVFSAVFLVMERLGLRRFIRRERKRGRFRRPVAFVSRRGPGSFGTNLDEMAEFEVVAHLDGETLAPYLETRDRQEDRVDLVVAVSDFEDSELWRIVVEAGQVGRSVFLHSPVRPIRRDRLTFREVGGRTLVKVSPPYLRGVRAFQKRAFDLVGASVLLLLTLPLTAIIALAILVTSGRPVLYGGERVGRDGKLFTMWKFRSMRSGAETESGAVATFENDPRRTPLGKILRRASLDELPQLWNVLLGQMSLVGPRPFPTVETSHPEFLARLDEQLGWAGYRHRIRPGITGWAQIHGLRGNTPLDPRVDRDNWYIENWSIALDVKILLKTLGETIRGRNAY
ncbi:MAG TPA: sugar transferase [Actinomycetota bacterium]|nr:sugar transferase [Actinomycetota bacterium]